MFLSRFPRSSLGNFGGYHGNWWIPGTTLLLPAEPSPSPSLLPPRAPKGTSWNFSACLNSFPFDFWKKALQLRLLWQIPTRCVLPRRKPVLFNLLLTSKKLWSAKLVLTYASNQDLNWQTCVGPLNYFLTIQSFNLAWWIHIGIMDAGHPITDKNLFPSLKNIN